MVFVDDPAAPVLTESDAHHLVDVLRLRPGEQVVASDGAGSWVPCRLVGAAPGWRDPGRPGPLLVVDGPLTEPTEAGARRSPWPSPRPRGIVPSGWSRSSPSWGWTASSPSRPPARWCAGRGNGAERAVDRLRRVAREAAAQSRRPWLPEVAEVTTVAELAGPTGRPPCLAHPGGEPPSLAHPVVAVGPEGGWDDDELDRAAAGWGWAPPCSGPRRRRLPQARSCAGCAPTWSAPCVTTLREQNYTEGQGLLREDGRSHRSARDHHVPASAMAVPESGDGADRWISGGGTCR